ncbi:protein shisa-like-2A [Cheilinus undulatus]|uniref:protein shisa-like-2A n=1 Tax=Cheilinus undulatus TaxID=241271 RepID=UPI001BD66B7C|nr:protein shisa-like-2A [Cheilinus undulatus]
MPPGLPRVSASTGQLDAYSDDTSEMDSDPDSEEWLPSERSGSCYPSQSDGEQHPVCFLKIMSAECSSYYSADGLLVDGFSCPKLGDAATAIYCCGFNDVKYCCDDPNSFFPYGYTWWLRTNALVDRSILAVVLLACITLCVLCYLLIATKPSHLDNGLPLRAPGTA